MDQYCFNYVVRNDAKSNQRNNRLFFVTFLSLVAFHFGGGGGRRALPLATPLPLQHQCNAVIMSKCRNGI